MLQRTLPTGFIAPCLPTKTTTLPSGGQWLHEIKHDGFRIIARKSDGRVRLYSRPGNDFTHRFPLIVEALERPRSRSCIIDGEAVACDDNGVASFDLVRHHRANGSVFLYAFDLIELNGDDLRRKDGIAVVGPSVHAIGECHPASPPRPVMCRAAGVAASVIACPLELGDRSAPRCVGCKWVIRIAGIHKIGTRGAQQSFDLLDRSLNHAARLAALNLAF
jgi:ATP dependent DNA ligase domain